MAWRRVALASEVSADLGDEIDRFAQRGGLRQAVFFA
jgi:hypothetical protein